MRLKQFTLDQITGQNQVYLLDIPDYVEDLSEILAYDYQHIFESELNGWYTDESLWPQNRTWNLFLQWFDVKRTGMILDLCPWEINKK